MELYKRLMINNDKTVINMINVKVIKLNFKNQFKLNKNHNI